MGFLVGRYFFFVLQGEADIIQSIQKTIFPELVDVERNNLFDGGYDVLLFKINGQFITGGGFDLLKEKINGSGRQHNGQNSVFETVVIKNIGERGR